MTLATRRFLYIIFIAAFCIITPLVILYANGYQLSLNRDAIIKTGMLIVNSKPKGAAVYIDGIAQQTFFNKLLSRENYIITPGKIKNILPGDYTVKFEMEGYWPWQKKLSINPGQSTYAEDVFLFKKSMPANKVAYEAKDVIASPDGNYLLVKGDKRVTLFDLNADSIVYSIETSASNISWSTDSSYFLIGHRVYSISNNNVQLDLDKMISPQISLLKWDLNNGNLLGFQFRNSLYQLNINNQQYENLLPQASTTLSQLLGNKNLIDYVIKDENIYLINQLPQKTSLSVLNPSSGKILRTIDLANYAAYSFINEKHKALNLYDNRNKTLYLIDPLNYYPIQETINNVNKSLWVNDNKLLYWNDFEIFVYDAGSKSKMLLTRISQPIKNVMWHSSNNYIFYTTDQKIYSLELDERDRRNTLELANVYKIQKAYFNPKGTSIYFSGQTKNQNGLFVLAIQ